MLPGNLSEAIAVARKSELLRETFERVRPLTGDDRVEIDLIARRGGTLVFVEVKSRRGRPRAADSTPRHGHAAEAVDARKQRRLRRGAHA